MVQIGDSVNLSLAGVNITGPKGTVIGPGTITVSRQRAEADMEGFTPASEGVEVALGGATVSYTHLGGEQHPCHHLGSHR